MIFAAYLVEGPATAWREAVARHARWLGLAARAGAIPLADARAFHFAWLGPASALDGEPNPSADDTPVIKVRRTSGSASHLHPCRDQQGWEPSLAWLGPASALGGEPNRSADDTPVILSTSGSMTPAPEARTPDEMARLLSDARLPAAIRIGVVPAAGEAVAAVPPAAVEQLYFARVGGGWALSNDLRLMARLAGSDLD